MESYPLLDRKSTVRSDYVTSLRAFFCDAVINWLYYCEDKNLTGDKLLDILEHTLENYIADVISMDAVQYYKAQSDLATLETSLCQQLVKDNIIKKVDSIENLSLFKPKANKRNSRTPSPQEMDNAKTEQGEEKENGNEEKKKTEEATEADDHKKEEAKIQEGHMEKKDDEIEGKEKGDEKKSEDNKEPIGENKETENASANKKRLNEEKPANDDIVEKKPKLDDEAIKDIANDLQDFEKATNPKYDFNPIPADNDVENEDEEELTSEEKVQRIREHQETITNFEQSRIYSPNPSHLFDIVFKVLKTLDADEDRSRMRIRELTELMNTHAEAFELA